MLALLGRPGTELSLHARLLAARLRCEVLSVPNAAAAEVAHGTHLGGRLAEAAAVAGAAGALLPSSLVAPLVMERLKRTLLLPRPEEATKLVLSGFPRTADQLTMLQQSGAAAGVVAAPTVVHLTLERAEAERRLATRRVCASCGEAMYPMPPSEQQRAKVAAASVPGGAAASAAAGAASAVLYTHLVEEASECDAPLPVHAASDASDAVLRRLDAFDQHTLPLLERLRSRGTEVIEVECMLSAEETCEELGHEPMFGHCVLSFFPASAVPCIPPRRHVSSTPPLGIVRWAALQTAVGLEPLDQNERQQQQADGGLGK